MKTQKVQIETIRLDPSNPRSITKEAFESLKKSITDFPEMQSVKPLVVADGYAIAGNMRLLAYKDLGYRELYVLDVSEWSQAKRDEFMIKDNTHYGSWDYDALANEWDNLPLNEWGVAVWDTEVEELKGLTDEDDVPEAPQEPITKLGDVWILGKHRVMCGDSTSKEAVDILMDGEKADMVFTDPPYNLQQRGQTKRTNKTKSKREDFGDWDVGFNPLDVIPNIIFYTKPEAHIFICTSNYLFGEIHDTLEGLELKPNYLVWCKNNPMPSLAKNRFVQATELIIHALKGSPLFKYPKGENLPNFFSGNVEAHQYGHPTQKPIYVVDACIKHSEGTILDLFLGSGSTLIAAEKTKRKCYGMELDPKYCDVIVKRWEDFTGKKAHLEENEFEVITQAN